jgi:acyl carrier protein
MTEQDLYARLSAILAETFDIEPERIRPEARLYEDLDIDSIDAVDLIVKLKPLVGRRLQPEAFKQVRTLQDVVNALLQLMQQQADAGNAGEGPSLAQAA